MKFLALMLSLFLTLPLIADSKVKKSFDAEFKVIKNQEGEIVAIKAKNFYPKLNIKLLIEDIENKVNSFKSLFAQKAMNDRESFYEEHVFIAPIDYDISHEAKYVKDSLDLLADHDFVHFFRNLKNDDLLKEFQNRVLDEIKKYDPATLTRMDDPRFFLKADGLTKVLNWGLNQASKRFSSVPVLNFVSQIMDQVIAQIMIRRNYYQYMLMHYLDQYHASDIGLSDQEKAMALSSIYVSNLGLMDIKEILKAKDSWDNYGVLKLNGERKIAKNLINLIQAGSIAGVELKHLKEINFSFSDFDNNGNTEVYHLRVKSHKYSKKPALAFDYAEPNKIKVQRQLLMLAKVGLSFVTIPNFLKGQVISFIDSFYMVQAQREGALHAYLNINSI